MAKSITIHGLDDSIARMIAEKASANGWSLNKTIKALIEDALTSKPQTKDKNSKDFAEFFGVWTKSDLRDFQQSTADLRKIDENDWK